MDRLLRLVEELDELANAALVLEHLVARRDHVVEVRRRPLARSSVRVMTKPAFRNESSRRRLARMSNWNSVFVKISWSGLKVVFVPVLSESPMTASGATGTPRRYSWK